MTIFKRRMKFGMKTQAVGCATPSKCFLIRVALLELRPSGPLINEKQKNSHTIPKKNRAHTHARKYASTHETKQFPGCGGWLAPRPLKLRCLT